MSFSNPYITCPFALFRQESTLSLIEASIRSEQHDSEKYRRMMNMTNDPVVRRQIKFAHDDELKHYNYFQNIYRNMSPSHGYYKVPPVTVADYTDLLSAVQSSIDGELEAVEEYRKILARLPFGTTRDIVYEIITDEQEHATRFVYLYSMLK